MYNVGVSSIAIRSFRVILLIAALIANPVGEDQQQSQSLIYIRLLKGKTKLVHPKSEWEECTIYTT